MLKHVLARAPFRKRDLSSPQHARPKTSTRINSVDGVQKPTQRTIKLFKDQFSRFGADMCTVDGRIFVLGVEEEMQKPTDGEDLGTFLPAARAGLSRFDEIVQLEHEDVLGTPLTDIYAQLFVAEKIELTVADRPCALSHTLAGQSTIATFLDECVESEPSADIKIVHSGAHSTCIPPSHAIVEVEGELVLSFNLDEIRAVVEYTSHQNECDVVRITTMPMEYAAAFMRAYQKSSSVAGSKDWKASCLLRRSLRHSSRRGSQRFAKGASSKLVPSSSDNLRTSGSSSRASSLPGTPSMSATRRFSMPVLMQQ